MDAADSSPRAGRSEPPARAGLRGPSRSRRAVGWALAGLVAGSSSGCAARPLALDDPERWPSGACVARFTVAHGDSPLAELRELGGWRDDFQDRFPAAIIDASVQRPVTASATVRLHDQPIAWFSRTLDAVVLDGAAFAPLHRADATQLELEERRVVGRVVAHAREALGDRAVLELLLRIDAIHGYWHLGADLCLTHEHEADGAYRAELRGVHQYLSKRLHEASLAFAVEIDAHGEIAVVGR